MVFTLEDLARDIARKRAELQDLECAAESLRPKGDRREWPDPDDPSQDLLGASIAESARRILGEADGAWVSYHDVASRAAARGYRSNRPTATAKVTKKSFFDIMNRQPEFERNGPLFRLRR